MTSTTEMIEIEQTMRSVRGSWLAQDGGLTMAASDLLAFGQNVLEKIQSNNVDWLLELDPFDSDTGAEADIAQAGLRWADKKRRRQIEDRLRKDERFFEQVNSLFKT